MRNSPTSLLAAGRGAAAASLPDEWMRALHLITTSSFPSPSWKHQTYTLCTDVWRAEWYIIPLNKIGWHVYLVYFMSAWRNKINIIYVMLLSSASASLVTPVAFPEMSNEMYLITVWWPLSSSSKAVLITAMHNKCLSNFHVQMSRN